MEIQTSALMEIHQVLRRRKLRANRRKKHPTSYIQRKVLTGTLLTVFVPETTAEMLK